MPFLARLAVAIYACLLCLGAGAEAPMSYIFYSGDTLADLRTPYLERVARAALERTRSDFGDFTLSRSEFLGEQRRRYLLEHNSGPINFSYFPYRPGLSTKLVPVRIPVDLGALGFRVLLIRRADQPIFSKIDTLEALKAIRLGSVETWADNEILRRAGLTVVTGMAHQGLPKMLLAGRFDAFSRSITEAEQDMDRLEPEESGIAIDSHLLIHYPSPGYFWFTGDEDGRNRAARMRVGLSRMVEDGSLAAMFAETFGPHMLRLDLRHRQMIELPASPLDPADPVGDARMWFKP